MVCDSALAGKAELRFDVLEKAAFISAVQLYGFFEGGEVWQARALVGTPLHQTLTSTGAGLRFAVTDNTNVDLEWAKPLDRDPSRSGKRDSRYFFSVGTNF